MLFELLRYIACILVIVGAINWGLVGYQNFDLVKYLNQLTLKQENLPNIIYMIVGVAGLYLILDKLVISKMQINYEGAFKSPFAVDPSYKLGNAMPEDYQTPISKQTGGMTSF
jgi:uncharacterized membrane protein YuzA (DUF378 family)